jgi:hypothetical protein
VCSYCGCDSNDVIDRLLAENEGTINATWTSRASVHSGDPDGVDDVRSVVLRLLWPHTAAEEADLVRVMAREEVDADRRRAG